MKRSILVLLIAFLISCVFLIGCAKESTTTLPATTTPATTPATTVMPDETITLIFSSHDSAVAYQSTDIHEVYFKEVEKRTGGRVKIEAHYSGELVALADAYDAVQKGTVDMAHLGVHFYPGEFLLASTAFTIPSWNYCSPTPSRIQMELYETFPEDQAEYSKIKPLMFYNMYNSYIATVSKPIRKLEDNAGLKMITGGEYGTLVGQALGWSAVSVKPPEVYVTWERGVADGGGMCPASCLFSNNWGEVVKYVTMVPMMRAPHIIGMNLDKWNSLPSDIKKILDDMIPEMTNLADEVEQQQEQWAIAHAPEEYGVEFIQLSPEEMARWAEVQKGPLSAALAKLEEKGLPAGDFYAAYEELEKKYSVTE